MTTLFVENLTVIDFSYIHSKRGLLGESWIMDIELTGELNDIGFIFDFGKVKKTIKQTVDEYIDHKCVIPSNAKNVVLNDEGKQTRLIYEYDDGSKIDLSSPLSALTIIDSDEINMSTITPFIEKKLLDVLPKNVINVEVHLREEHIDASYYHYSHGLKKHDGNCQRIAHGHRSKIQIWENGHRSNNLESLWAKKLKDSYIGSKEDLIDEILISETSHYVFEYETIQGLFKLTIPREKCIVIDTESSVENIALYIAKESSKLTDQRPLKVRAFEGVGKGAIARI